ncbi:unnamed protein product [Prorocentrum cordatum]|nr:unnamed protein product [Polarella glacialis]
MRRMRRLFKVSGAATVTAATANTATATATAATATAATATASAAVTADTATTTTMATRLPRLDQPEGGPGASARHSGPCLSAKPEGSLEKAWRQVNLRFVDAFLLLLARENALLL